MIVNGNELSEVRADLQDQTIALRLGCYDVLHYGHQKGINFASSQADILAVGVMSDEYIARRKGRLSVNPVEKRLQAIDAAEGVDVSFVISNVGALAIARTLFALHPDVYVEGAEHGERLARSLVLGRMGIRYVIDRTSKVESSSDIIAHFGSAEAARLSGLGFHPNLMDSKGDFQVSA